MQINEEEKVSNKSRCFNSVTEGNLRGRLFKLRVEIVEEIIRA